MTKLLEKAIEELNKLPEPQQESMAQWILVELEDEASWDQTFSDSLPQLEKLGKKDLRTTGPGGRQNSTRTNWHEITDQRRFLKAYRRLPNEIREQARKV